MQHACSPFGRERDIYVHKCITIKTCKSKKKICEDPNGSGSTIGYRLGARIEMAPGWTSTCTARHAKLCARHGREHRRADCELDAQRSVRTADEQFLPAPVGGGKARFADRFDAERPHFVVLEGSVGPQVRPLRATFVRFRSATINSG